MALTDLTRISTAGIATGTSLSGAILHGDAHFRGTNAGINSAIFDSSENELNLKDNVKLTFGNAGTSDSQFYFDSNNLILQETSASGSMLLRGQNIRLQNPSQGNENYIECLGNNTDRRVKIYQGTTTRFETTGHGAVVTGILTASTFSGPLSNASGISTFYDLRVSNNLTVEGTTTTLDTNVTGVDRLEINANSNTNTAIVGIQSGTADIVNLFDGTTQVVTVDDTGKLGLGTNAPAAKLEAYGTDASIIVHNQGESRGGIAAFENQRLALVSTHVNDDLVFGYSNNPPSTVNFVERMRIDSGTGFVGIGSTIPAATVDIQAVSSSHPALNLGGGGGNNGDLTVNSGESLQVGHFNRNTSTFDERMRISNTGSVGINTTNPQNTLEVVGTGISVFNQAKNAGVDIHGVGKIELTRSDGVAYIDFKSSYGEDFDCRIQQHSNGLRFFTGGNGSTDENFNIQSDGSIGVNIDSPDGQFHIHQSSAGSVNAAADANDLVVESSANVGMSFLTAANSLARIKFGSPTASNSGGIIYNHQNDKLSIVTGTGNRMIIGADMISARTHYGVARTVGGYTFREVNEGGERAGMHSNASNHLIFKAGGADEKVRITNNGDVGIGTDNPTQGHVLHIFKDGAVGSTENDRKYNGRFTTRTPNNLNLDIYDRRWSNGNTHGWIGTEKRIEFNVDDNTSKRMWISFFNANSTTTSNVIRFGEQEDTEWMRIFDGKVGIGTINPSRPLHIENADCRIRLTDTGNPTDVELQNNSGNAVLTTNGASQLRLQTNNEERLVITDVGRIGIGTEDPDQKLTVFDGAQPCLQSGATTFRVDQNASNWNNLTNNTGPILAWDYKSGPGDLMYMGSGGNTPFATQMALVVSDAHGFKVGRSGYDGTDFDVDSSNEYFRINTDGQVQVRTTTQSTVSTNGSLVVSGGVGIAKNIICGGTVEVQNNSLIVTSATPTILMAVPSGGLDSRIHNDGSGSFIIGHGTNSSSPPERLKIGSDGKLVLTTEGQESAEFNTTHASGAYQKYDLGSSGATIGYIGASNQLIVGGAVGDFGIRAQGSIRFSTGGDTERFRIDSGGQLRSVGQLFIRNAAPTIYMRDTDHYSAMLHQNSNYFHVLRADGSDSAIWAQYNNQWPLMINMGNNNAHFGGDVTATGSITGNSSDRRLKKNLVKIETPLEKISKLTGYNFDWNDNVTSLGFTPSIATNDVGLIAQDVQEVVPQAVVPAPFDLVNELTETDRSKSRSGENYLTIQYDKIVPLLVEAIKELKAEIDALKSS